MVVERHVWSHHRTSFARNYCRFIMLIKYQHYENRDDVTAMKVWKTSVLLFIFAFPSRKKIVWITCFCLSFKPFIDNTIYEEEIGDGNLNDVTRIFTRNQDGEIGHSLIVKQSLPYIKVSTALLIVWWCIINNTIVCSANAFLKMLVNILDPIYTGLALRYRYCIYWKYVVLAEFSKFCYVEV